MYNFDKLKITSIFASKTNAIWSLDGDAIHTLFLRALVFLCLSETEVVVPRVVTGVVLGHYQLL